MSYCCPFGCALFDLSLKIPFRKKVKTTTRTIITKKHALKTTHNAIKGPAYN